MEIVSVRRISLYKSSFKEPSFTADTKMLKLQSCKLYNTEYMITSTQITNTETLAFVAVLVSKLLSCLKTEKAIEIV